MKQRRDVSKQRLEAERRSSRPAAYALNNINEEVNNYDHLIQIVETLPEDYAPPAISEREQARTDARRGRKPRTIQAPAEASSE